MRSRILVQLDRRRSARRHRTARGADAAQREGERPERRRDRRISAGRRAIRGGDRRLGSRGRVRGRQSGRVAGQARQHDGDVRPAGRSEGRVRRGAGAQSDFVELRCAGAPSWSSSPPTIRRSPPWSRCSRRRKARLTPPGCGCICARQGLPRPRRLAGGVSSPRRRQPDEARGRAYSADATEKFFAEVAAVFTPALLDRFADQGARSPAPIFVVGMPRSGTTLIEQILAAHPSVHGAGELRIMRSVVEQIRAFPRASRRWTPTR